MDSFFVDAHGNRILEGTTDDQGRFSFPKPGPGSLSVVLHAGMGHRAEWQLESEKPAEAAERARPAEPEGEPAPRTTGRDAGDWRPSPLCCIKRELSRQR